MDDEMVELVSCFTELGIRKIRITGGEPLLRPGIINIVRTLSKIPDVSDLSLSTNGILLHQFAADLADAGLQRINVSMDSLNPEKFHQITRLGKLEHLFAGFRIAVQCGLSPIKINVVVVRGMNEEEIPDFVKLTETMPLHVRFIELMPMGETGFFTKERWVPFEEMLKKASPLQALPQHEWPLGHGPARYYQRPGAKGTVGFITALSCGFCSSCNRVRLSSKGMMIPCLDGSEGTDLRILLRSGASREEIKQAIVQTIQEKKPERHFMLERVTHQITAPSVRFMCQVGG
jgi:cyclic pyranopterin phosphate synthase